MQRLSLWLLSLNFVCSKKDPCIWILRQGTAVLWLAVYVDDLCFCGTCCALIATFKKDLASQFKFTDLGELKWFLGQTIHHDRVTGTLDINQTKYVNDLMERFEFMADVPDSAVPGDSNKVPTAADCPTTDAAKSEWWRVFYRAVIGSLLYLAVCTRPDIAPVVAHLSRFLSNPGIAHWNAAVKCLAYVRATKTLGIRYTRAAGDFANTLVLFVDATWADCSDTRKSTTGLVCFLNGGPISWKSKLQPIIAQSSCEAELIAACKGCNEAAFLRCVLEELGFPQPITRCYEDNRAALIISKNPGAIRDRSKHFELRWFKIQEYVSAGALGMVEIGTKWQLADALTKWLPRVRFEFLRGLLLGTVPFDHSKYEITASTATRD
jgi:hypothetical protein